MENFTLSSEAFENKEVIPKKYGYKNGNISPSLNMPVYLKIQCLSL